MTLSHGSGEVLEFVVRFNRSTDLYFCHAYLVKGLNSLQFSGRLGLAVKLHM